MVLRDEAIKCVNYYQIFNTITSDITRVRLYNLIHAILVMLITSVITAKDSGFLSAKNTGLGNVLFQIASCYGLAKITGRKPVWNNVVEFSDKLKTLYNYNHKNTIFRNCKDILQASFTSIHESHHLEYDTMLINQLLSRRVNIEVVGYLECLQYFHTYRTDILNLFSIDPISLDMIQTLHPVLFDMERTTVSIHFRGNEYLTHPSIGAPWDYNYYKRAVEYFNDIINPVFIIFSDDVEKIDLSFLGGRPYMVIKNTEDYLDLWCQSLCKHNILSRSTFSFWGAYLNTTLNTISLYNKNETLPFHCNFIPI